MRDFLYKTLSVFLIAGLPAYVPLIIYLFCIKPWTSGDLDALAMTPSPQEYVKQDFNFKKNILDVDYDDCKNDSCILVIGNSFSQSYGNTVTSYVNYLAENSALPVYNLSSHWDKSSVLRYLYLAKQNKLPRIVVLECVERWVNERFTNVDWDISVDELNLEWKEPKSWKKIYAPIRKDFYRSQDLVKIHLFKFDNAVRYCDLSKPLFSIEDGRERTLCFYRDDLNFQYETLKYDEIIETMQKLNQIALENKCLLLFVVAADKYDLYSPYIIDNPYPTNHTLDSLSNIANGINFINTKEILSPLLERGVKDVYWCNDVHWSPVGSKIIGEYICGKIRELQNE